MRASDLADRRVALYGLGRDTRAAYAHLRARLPDQELELLLDTGPIPADVEADPLLHPHVGEDAHRLLRRGELDVVIRSPGVSIRVGPLTQAPSGTTVVTSLALAFSELTAPVVGVTGTKGKSSTSSMVAHLLRRSGRRVGLAGNIGTPALEMVGRSHDLVVLELSSYQLADLEASLEVGVLLNLYREHLDWHGDYDTYVADKARILRLSSRVIANADHPEVRRLAEPHQPRWWSVGEREVQVGEHTLARSPMEKALERAGLVGGHQVSNAAAALATGSTLGVDPEAAVAWLDDVPRLPHRLQLVAAAGGVRWVDDSISTIPESTVAAIDAFDGAPITLVVGGHDRGQDHHPLVERIPGSSVGAVLTLPDTGARVAVELRGCGCKVEEMKDLEGAVVRAAEITPRGGVVLLSPAAPSYGRFRDFEERGDRFAELVRGLGV